MQLDHARLMHDARISGMTDRTKGQEIIGIQVSSDSAHNVKQNLDASFLSASIISMPIRSQTKNEL